MSLAEKECVPCRGGVPPLTEQEWQPFLAELKNWTITDGKLSRTYEFKDFRGAMNLAIKAGDLADRIDHHPDLHISWGKLKVEIWTHKINGLTESDFILAAKIDQLGE